MNRTILVTGGTSGIGLATAKQLAREGARLALLGRSEDRLTKVIEELPAANHFFALCDLTSEEETETAIKKLAQTAGTFFAGAVFCAGTHLVRPLSLMKGQHYTDMFSANFNSAVFGIKPFVKLADPQGAAVVFVSSAAALRGGAGVAAYSAAKGALIAAARCFAMELATKYIRVNTVVPGVVMTPMTDKFFNTLPKQQQDAIVASHPLGIGTPDAIASGIAFLLSQDANWITGTELVIDGGLTCKS